MGNPDVGFDDDGNEFSGNEYGDLEEGQTIDAKGNVVDADGHIDVDATMGVKLRDKML
jgi:hypothetical protein